MPSKESAIEWMKSVKKAIHEENGKDLKKLLSMFHEHCINIGESFIDYCLNEEINQKYLNLIFKKS